MHFYCIALGILELTDTPSVHKLLQYALSPSNIWHIQTLNKKPTSDFSILQKKTKKKGKERERETHPWFLHRCKEKETVPSKCGKVNFIVMHFSSHVILFLHVCRSGSAVSLHRHTPQGKHHYNRLTVAHRNVEISLQFTSNWLLRFQLNI